MSNDINTETELRRLADLTPIEYDRERKEGAERLSIRLDTLDAEVQKLRPPTPATLADRSRTPGILEPVTPWHEPVAGAELLEKIRASLSRFMVLPEGAAAAISLWALFAHAHDAAEHSPILSIESPEKRCGKTTLLLIVGQLVPVPLPAANITTAAIFRSIAKFRPTLLLDEVETFIRDNEEMRGVLNSGFTRLSAFVIRTVGEDFDPKQFSTWCPKVAALIGNLPDTLQDRSIVLTLRRRLPNEQTERFNARHHNDLHRLRAMAARWAADNLALLQAADPEMPEGLNDRAEDCWRPLLAIADAAGGEWPKIAREAALVLSGVGDDEASTSAGVMLLTHIREVFQSQRAATITSSNLVRCLTENESWPWGEWQHGKPITTHGIARTLKRYSIAPRKSRLANQYEAANFKDAWERYLISPAELQPARSSTSSTAPKNINQHRVLSPILSSSASSTSERRVEVAKTEVKPVFSGFVEDVEVARGGAAGGRINGQVIDDEQDIIEGRI